MEFEELRQHEGKLVWFGEIPFKFLTWSDSGGEWAGFTELDENLKEKQENDADALFVYATLNYEGRGIPIDVADFEGGGQYCDHYLGEVKDWDDYVKLVRVMVERLLAFKDRGVKPC